MKTNHFDGSTPIAMQARKHSRRAPSGMGVSSALLGVACGIGVFAVLTLLYHFG